MQMRVMLQTLAPGMQDGDEADLCAQMSGIRRDRAQSLGCGVKQDVVDGGLILVCNRGDFFGQREDDVEIVYGDEVGLAIFQSLRAHQRLALRTVPIAATVVGDALVAASVTLLYMPAERFRAATLDRAHDAALPTAEGISVLLAIIGSDLAEDVRHFEPGGSHHPPQKWAGGSGGCAGHSTWGSQSKGLAVAHTVRVATFR